MPDDFLLAYASFNADNQPFIDCQIGDEIKRRELFGQDLSLEFDFSTKYCTGWVDFDNHCSQICPDSATVDGKYENYLKCRDRTGFNPAFYNADSVSAQQEKINQNPHFVYLAYFAPEVIKVGISQDENGVVSSATYTGSKKQLSDPVWHAGPSFITSTLSASLSQSTVIDH